MQHKTPKTFRVITKNGKNLFFNPRIRFDDGIIQIENFRFEVSAVNNLIVDKRNNIITLDFTGEKVESMCNAIEFVKEYANSLQW